jgi:hypothetical protein
VLPETQMDSVVPGYAQHDEPAPQAPHGQVVHAGEVKKAVHAPCTHTSSVWQTLPHCPQLSGLLASSAAVRQAPWQFVWPICPQLPTFWQVPWTQRWPAWVLHTVPQAPQFCASLRKSRQVLPQRFVPGRHWHEPARQAWRPLHWVPHMPQSVGLVWSAAHAPLHIVPAQEHEPLLHESPCGQTLLQLPQWVGSLPRLLQVPPHWVAPPGQVHWPFRQVSPAGHWDVGEKQAPQWAASLVMFTQPVNWPQLTSPAGHWQAPLVHTAPGPHWLPHWPQLLTSPESVAQPRLAPQFVWPMGQAQAPAVQVEPGPHFVWQLPQWLLSVSGLLHVPPQAIWPPMAHAWQTPAAHRPELQTCPQVPQLSGSVAVAAQVPGLFPVLPQTTSVATVQFGPHTPALQAMPTAHLVPQAPQLSGSAMVSEQTPLQASWPAGQTHWPDVQLAPRAQARPHVPQLAVSLERSAQPLPGQFTRPALQVHTPVMQAAPAPQTLPQVPQLKLSVLFSTHCPLHTVGVAAGQPHWPEVHVPPMGQAVPQVPQLAVSAERSAQPLGQVVLPIGQVQLPPAHTAPALQALPQLPQLAASAVVSVHTELQRVGVAVGQAQAPARQVAPTPQACAHWPQLEASLCRLVQLPSQVSGRAPPQGWQVPVAHISPRAQACPQVPQLAASFFVSMQVPLQSVSPPQPPAPPVPDELVLVLVLLLDELLLAPPPPLLLAVLVCPPCPPVPELTLPPQPSAI